MKKGEPKEKRRRPKGKAIDCVAMKRRAQARIHAITKDMSPEQELAFWNRPPDEPLSEWRRRSRPRRRA